MFTFSNLPNDVDGSKNNLTAEAKEYYKLYTALNRSMVGEVVFISESSDKRYSTMDEEFRNDPDVYNKGQQGMMNLLYKKLKSYIITAEAINRFLQVTTGLPVTSGNTEFADGKYKIYLDEVPSSGIFSLTFKAPENYKAGSQFEIIYNKDGKQESVLCNPKLSGSVEPMPDNTFLKNRVITTNIDIGASTATFNSSSTSMIIKQDSEPTTETDKSKMWINTSNNTLNYWNDKTTKWTGIVGVWG